MISFSTFYDYGVSHRTPQPEGSMVCGRFCVINANVYYFDYDGTMATGLQNVDGVFHYFDEYGRMCIDGEFKFGEITYVYAGYFKYLPEGAIDAMFDYNFHIPPIQFSFY